MMQEKLDRKYPSFEFDKEGFIEMRKYAYEIDNIDEKVDFYNFQINRYDETHSS
ncbi:MAG: hypothetical protein GF353_10845, partial [Candidatus Lokiarchaeota archaeon]|nr:hypothetical protein [Candidatus Lokiarchaeota archaeon]